MDSPELKWYEIQPSLGAWDGDVLMILDCCYAFQAVRDRDSRTFELLAACGIRESTPQAGPLSFTSALINIMDSMLRAGGVVKISELYDKLLKLESPLAATPLRALWKGEESIELRPVLESSIGDSIRERPTPLTILTLTISLSRKVDDVVLKRLNRWMRTYLPKGVETLTVDKVFARVETIQAFLQQTQIPDLQKRILHELKGRDLLEDITLQTRAQGIDQPSDHDRTLLVRSILQELQNWNDAVYQSLETNLLLNPHFYSKHSLHDLSLSAPARALGLADAARMRLLALTLDDDAGLASIKPLRYDRFERLKFSQIHPGAMHTYGKLETTYVLIERRNYSAQLPREKMARNVKRLDRLLRETTSSSLPIAEYEGYVDEPMNSCFGLIFRLPIRALEAPVHRTLKDLYEKVPMMPLNSRMKIAYSLASGISNLHAVGWVHKSLCSTNILFFPDPEATGNSGRGLKLSQPYLFGFDLARPQAASSEHTKEYRASRFLYTHPQRWAAPQETFNSIHDIYSLGVIFLELGCWKIASEFDPVKQGFAEVNDEWQIRKHLIAAAKTYLPHYAGRRYSDIVLSCLSGSLAPSTSDHNPAQLLTDFRHTILEGLLKVSASL
jgi:hypothetical protein